MTDELRNVWVYCVKCDWVATTREEHDLEKCPTCAEYLEERVYFGRPQERNA